MYRQPAAVLVISTLTQQIEQLGISHADKEIERRIRIADNKEQRRFPISNQVKLQLVIHGDLPDFLNVEGGKSGTTGNKDRFCCLARRKFVFFILA